MKFMDRVFGRNRDLTPEPLSTTASRADNSAVADYERLLRSAPSETIEKVHVEAFEKLTPEQLDILFDRFSREAENDTEKPADAQPSSLARVATRAETHKPGSLRRILSGLRYPAPGQAGYAGMDTSTWIRLSLLDTIATYAIASAVWGSWDYGVAGADGGVDPSANDPSSNDLSSNDPGGNDPGGDGGFWDIGF